MTNLLFRAFCHSGLPILVRYQRRRSCGAANVSASLFFTQIKISRTPGNRCREIICRTRRETRFDFPVGGRRFCVAICRVSSRWANRHRMHDLSKRGATPLIGNDHGSREDRMAEAPGLASFHDGGPVKRAGDKSGVLLHPSRMASLRRFRKREADFRKTCFTVKAGER